MRASAPAWSTLPMAFQMRRFGEGGGSSPAKVMVPRQSVETSRPVLPRVLYCIGFVASGIGYGMDQMAGRRMSAVKSSRGKWVSVAFILRRKG